MSKIMVGETLPDYQLPDENGELHRLSELQGDDVLVLLLGRGEHCPRERQHQRELLKFHEWCSVAFTQLVTVLPNDLHDVFKLKISTGAHWTWLADTELELQKALDFFFQAEAGIRAGRVTGVQTCALPISLILGTVVVLIGVTVYADRATRFRGLERSEERRVGKECRSRWSPNH